MLFAMLLALMLPQKWFYNHTIPSTAFEVIQEDEEAIQLN
jgi:hypothetical protein